MVKLKAGAYTGSMSENPYNEGLDVGVAYDEYQANSFLVENGINWPEINTFYRWGARKLIENTDFWDGQTILDLGSGTGISTIELLLKYPHSSIYGIEIARGMIDIANYKFNKVPLRDLDLGATDKKLLEYWVDFRRETVSSSDRIKFCNEDIQKLGRFKDESIDNAIANQSLHWVDIRKTFNRMYEVLKPEGEVIWNTASHFYSDPNFPAEEYGFRYHNFLGKVMKLVSEDYPVKDYRMLGKPNHELDSLKTLVGEDFETRQVATYLIPLDLQLFIDNHLPFLVRELTYTDENNSQLEETIKKAISQTILDEEALKDKKHKFDIIPVFNSKKK